MILRLAIKQIGLRSVGLKVIVQGAGVVGAAIAAALDGPTPCRFADDMQDAVREAARLAAPGNTVLLAPACASLDQYANYSARGDAFIDAVLGSRA